jgi:hypothetical protein
LAASLFCVFRNNSGSLAIFAAILRASSLLSNLAAERRPGSVGRRLKSERRFAGFLNGPRRVLDLSQCLLIGLYLKLSITYSKIWKDSNGAREE